MALFFLVQCLSIRSQARRPSRCTSTSDPRPCPPYYWPAFSEQSTDIVSLHRTYTFGSRVGHHVSSDRHSTTATKVVEGCLYIRRRLYAILPLGEKALAPRSLLVLFSLSSSRKKIKHLSEHVAVRASELGLYEHTSGLRKVRVLVPGAKGVCTRERFSS